VKIKLILIISLLLTAVWISGFSMFSFISKDSSLHTFYPFFKISYGRVCHQAPLKSFSVNGWLFLVCARCTGIYFGVFLGMLLSTLPTAKYILFSYKYFIAFSLLMLLDAVTNNFIFVEYNRVTAFLTGYLFSFFAVNFVILELRRNYFFHHLQIKDF